MKTILITLVQLVIIGITYALGVLNTEWNVGLKFGNVVAENHQLKHELLFAERRTEQYKEIVVNMREERKVEKAILLANDLVNRKPPVVPQEPLMGKPTKGPTILFAYDVSSF